MGNDVSNNPITAGLKWRQGTCLDTTSFVQYQAVKLSGPNTYVPCDITDRDSSIAGIVLVDRSPGQRTSIPIALLTSDTPLPLLDDGTTTITAGSALTGFLTLSTTVAGAFFGGPAGIMRAVNSGDGTANSVLLGCLSPAGTAGGTDIPTLATTYADGTVAADQTMTVQTANGGPVIVKGGAAGLGSLLKVLTSAAGVLLNITDNASQTIKSFVADGASAVGLIIDTNASLANATAKLFSVRNAAAELMYQLANGNLIVDNAVGIGKDTIVGFSSVYDASGNGAMHVGPANQYNATGHFITTTGMQFLVAGATSNITVADAFMYPGSGVNDYVSLGSVRNNGSVGEGWWLNVAARIYSTKPGGTITAANTIAPTNGIHALTGNTAIHTITIPFTGFKGTIILIPDDVNVFSGGNMGATYTGVAGIPIHLTCDGTSWWAK